MKRLVVFLSILGSIPGFMLAGNICDGPISNPDDTSSIFAAGEYSNKNKLIGTKTSMAKNLAVTNHDTEANKSSIKNKTAWEKFPEPGYCWYSNDREVSRKTNGTLHIWYIVNTAKLCPNGWHESTEAEWTIMTNYMGNPNISHSDPKGTGITYLNESNTGSINSDENTAFPAGNPWYHNDIIGTGSGIQCYLWSSVERISDDTWRLYMNSDNYNAVIAYKWKLDGSYVRCLRD
jgi:uncharacterized protein (TIGR02145 family)